MKKSITEQKKYFKERMINEMNIDKLLEENNFKFKKIKIGKNIELFEFENETMLIIIRSSNNVFKINRKDFYKIDDRLLPYNFYLINEVENKTFYITVKEPANFLRNAFENSLKNEIYFGKDVLNNKINNENLIEKIRKIGDY